MRILVVSRISIPARDRTLPCWEYLRSLGHEVVVEHPDSVPSGRQPDAIISMGVTVMQETFRALSKWPEAPVFCYNWDCYEWVWEPGQGGRVQARHPSRPNEYDYVQYGELLRMARVVWVPSRCTGVRTTQWWGVRSWEVILSACPWWDYPYVRDDGYALCCLREIPDPAWGMFERCCAQVGIPCMMPKHELSYEAYQDAVAGCRFICAPLYELSTGGLSLMEAYRLGKPVLISDSPWNGARDYMDGLPGVRFFDHSREEDLCKQLLAMWKHPPIFNVEVAKRVIESEYSDQRMVDDMLLSIRRSSGLEV